MFSTNNTKKKKKVVYSSDAPAATGGQASNPGVRSITNYDITSWSGGNNESSRDNSSAPESSGEDNSNNNNNSSSSNNNDNNNNNNNNTTSLSANGSKSSGNKNDTSKSNTSVKSDSYFGWEEISINYGGGSDASRTGSDPNKKLTMLQKIGTRLGLIKVGDESILPSFYKQDGTLNNTSGMGDDPRTRSGEDTPNTNSGPLLFRLNGKKQKISNGESEENNSKDDSRGKLGALIAKYCCGIPALLLLLLLLLAAVAVASVVLFRQPRGSDKAGADELSTNEPVPLFPTPAPTDTPLLKACVCYPLLLDDIMTDNNNIITPDGGGGEGVVNSDTIYNIGGIDYKCLDEQYLTDEQAQSADLTICVFPHPNAEQNLDDYHLKKGDNVDGISDSVIATTTGELSVPNLNQEVQVVGVTATGSFATTNLDISSFNEEQISEIMGYFEDAIAQEVDLPVGSIVNVTSIDENGVVQYEITTYAESSTEANAAANSVSTALSQASTLVSITESVIESSQASSDVVIQSAITSSTSIASHTTGGTTESTASKVTSTGELSVAGFDPSVLTPAEIEEAKHYFESAITQELVSQGLLQQGSSVVVVTDISSNGSSVQYDIIFYGLTSTEASSAITDVQTSLSNTSTLASISSIVQEESSSSSSSAAVSTSLSTVSITENTQLGTTGLTLSPVEEEIVKVYFEEAIAASLGSILPPGSTVTVTSVKDGVVSYEITMEVSSSDVAEATVTAIESSLAEQSTLEAISSSVQSASSASTYPTLVNAMSGISVVSNTVGCGCSRRSRELNNALHRELNSCCSGTSAIPALSDGSNPDGVVSNTPGITSVVPSTPSTVSLNSLQMVSSYDLGVDVYILCCAGNAVDGEKIAMYTHLLTICFLSHSSRISFQLMAPLHHTTC